MSTLPIHETFHSWQGEGLHMGRSACFIRLFGCPLHCPWCDSAGTWHPDYIPEKVKRLESSYLADWALSKGPDFVVITGGEPAIHDLTELTANLRERGLPVHLETSGAFALQGTFDWITVSPKRAKQVLPENLRKAHEQKWIIETPGDLEYWDQQIQPTKQQQPIWLHPEWSKRNDSGVLQAISQWIKSRGAPFRAGWQLHKLFRVDELDSGTAKPAPLGGNPDLGY